MPDEPRYSVHTSPKTIQRVEVELSIDGTEYVFSGPNAQILGQHLVRAGGGKLDG